jgi:hypothetical protein
VSLPTWHEVPLSELAVDPGWRYPDSVLLEKLMTSLRRHGQLRALVVRRTPIGVYSVVDGRSLLKAMQALGWATALVADIGVVDTEAAQRLALDLDLRFDTDYARLAVAVAAMLEAGATPDALAGASPYTAERLGYLARLATFDWSQYREVPHGQGALSWEAEAELLAVAAMPALEPASQPSEPFTLPPDLPQVPPDLESVDTSEPIEDVAESVWDGEVPDLPAVAPDLGIEEGPAQTGFLF